MSELTALSSLFLPFLKQNEGESWLLTGYFTETELVDLQDTRSYSLTTPFSLTQLQSLPVLDIAFISDLVETTDKQVATQWLATLRNQYAAKIVLLVDHTKTNWDLTDFLALGFRQQGQHQHFTIYGYAIESYQFHKDWLNSRHWANPENFDKYRW